MTTQEEVERDAVAIQAHAEELLGKTGGTIAVEGIIELIELQVMRRLGIPSVVLEVEALYVCFRMFKRAAEAKMDSDVIARAMVQICEKANLIAKGLHIPAELSDHAAKTLH